MITLTLNNGTSYEVAETSTPSAIVITGNAMVITSALSEITTDNLKNATLGETVLTNLVATGGTFKNIENGTVTATFTTREKTDMEVMREEISEVQDALIELAGE